MKIKSKYFDDIRVKPEDDRTNTAPEHVCEWEGCDEEGEFKASGKKAGEFRFFCLKHIREYNASYNYFEGMDDEDIKSYQRDAATGHRPTWRMGVEKELPKGSEAPPHTSKDFVYARWQREQARRAAMRSEGGLSSAPKRKTTSPAAQKAFDAMGLDAGADADAIKAKYKDLVKRLHPDANGGDRKYEDRLREIISSYSFLKRSGYC